MDDDDDDGSVTVTGLQGCGAAAPVRESASARLPQFSGYCSEISKVSSAKKNMMVNGLAWNT